MPRFDCEHGFELAEFKAVGGDEPTGEFEAIVSVFNNVDLGGDRVMPGAFGKSLARWREKGDPIPVIWNHMWDQPEAHIGAVNPDDAEETDGGLKVKGRIDLDNPFAKQVFRLLSQRRVKEFSFGYDVKDSKRDKSGVNDLLELDVIELGPTLKGMNPATELLAVKALAAAASTKESSTRISELLTAAGKERYGDDETYVWLADWDPDEMWAVYEINSNDMTRLARVTFAREGNDVSLDDGDTEVTRVVTYVSKGGAAWSHTKRIPYRDLLAADRHGDGENETKSTIPVAPPESDPAQSTASDPDEDIRTRITLLKET